MTVEMALACVIAFAVALVQVTRRTILASRQSLGVLQIGAAGVCAALVPTLSVYTLHFHPTWALGVEPGSYLAVVVVEQGFAVALGTALVLWIVAAVAYAVSVRMLLAGHRTGSLYPAAVAVALVIAVLVRGGVGGRFSGEDPPPALIATAVVLLFLVAALLGASRLDAESEA
ncbi:MAG: hypothetical protein ABIJ09_21040 [Pseudomonadota bacterium]